MQIKITFSPFKFPSGKWREEERRGGEGEGERKGRGIKKKKNAINQQKILNSLMNMRNTVI